MKPSLRFALGNLFVPGAAFLAIISDAFSATVAGWLASGVSTRPAVLAAASMATAHGPAADRPRRGRARRPAVHRLEVTGTPRTGDPAAGRLADQASCGGRGL